jgi:RNA polymerase sigma-70 factor (ECF subfamily)
MFYLRHMPPLEDASPSADFLPHAAEPFRAALRVHCYRMLGCVSDVEDVMQEVLMRAWRGRDSLTDMTKLRPWLYCIATNACLDALAERPTRMLGPSGAQAAGDPSSGIGDVASENLFIEPMPTAWAAAEGCDPASQLARKESVTLAFVTALQTLTPMQRATLLLRDVVELSAEETADALAVTSSAANSALFRARTALSAATRDEPAMTIEVDPALLARYVHAWETSDVETIIAMLRDDVRTTMPPRPKWFDGLAANAIFYRRMFSTMQSAPPPRIVVTSANAAPALAFYRTDAPAGPYTLRALQVLAICDGGIARIHHFTMPGAFSAFGLATTLDTQAHNS